MKDNNGFSLYEQLEATNQVLSFSYTPSSSTSRYTYNVMKNGEPFETYEVSGNKTSEILLDDTGTYQVVVTEYHGRTIETIESGFYHIDMDSPVIHLKEGNILTIEKQKKGTVIDMNQYIVAYDEQDGDITNQVTYNASDIDLLHTGTQQIVYTVADQAGNTTTQTISLNIVKNQQLPLFMIQLTVVIGILLLIFWWVRYQRSLRLERRLSLYSIRGLKDHSISIVEKVIQFCHKTNMTVSNLLQKSVFLQKYSKHYDKYIPLYRPFYQSGMDVVATKLLSGIGFIFIAIFTMAFERHVFVSYELLLPFIFGFYLPDLLYFSKYKLYRNQLENDLLQAIIIMNNAFKSGRSITQAIDLVTKELNGPIAEEFKKMLLELSFGISIEETFKRFSKRIQLEEVTYLTASLSILNRTGGNIIKVFTSIERSLFNKKKLRLELASLTGSSKIIVYVLFLVPPLFILFISLLNPSYFTAMYSTPIGLLLCGIILFIYIGYIIVVRKVMKVRM